MSTIQDDNRITPLERTLPSRLLAEREARGWSISDLATRSGVSRAMISKVERGEASPTAVLLGRLSGAFGLTLTALFARAERDAVGTGRLARQDAQAIWRDPGTGYLRRAVSPPGAEPELVHVELPPRASVAYPASAYAHLRGQCIWVLQGELLFREGDVGYQLTAGDCLALGPPTDCEFRNPSATAPCIYLVAIVAASGPSPKHFA
jgi:transcriptional regulator with XRE-family HTH domain